MIPLVFHNRPTSNHRAGPILRWDQLQSEASWFTALPDATLYTTTFSRDFQALDTLQYREFCQMAICDAL